MSKDTDSPVLLLDEKLTLLTGGSALCTASIPQKGIKSIRMADGPNGIKTDNGDSTCIMGASLMASSWDKDICYEMGRIIGTEASRLGVDMVLAPAINLKRNPLAGRNFEYYSEDPFLTGYLATEYIKGIKSTGVLVCAKHFACNNQEFRRWTQNSVIDDDTLRNLYLKAFQMVLERTEVDAIMASYNRINGIHACENKYLLSDILRKEWKFDGVVMSDWCAINRCIDSYKKGLDLEMPGNAHNTVAKLKTAVVNGELSETEINRKAERILLLSKKAMARVDSANSTIDLEKLIQMTGESFVLLKNDGVLPCKSEDKVLLIGAVKEPRIQGGGCAEMKTNVVKTPLEEITKYAKVCDYMDGYDISNKVEEFRNYDKIVVILSLPEECDSEAFDRKDMCFPIEQTSILKEIKQYNENIVVVLQNGSAVDLYFENDVRGILETYYAGSYGACALADVLYGKINPSGKLAETIPMNYDDVPSANFFGHPKDVVYAEREFVGYRYYTSYAVETRYPFGFGLSYCDFVIEDVDFTRTTQYGFDVSFDVTNTSQEYDGKETVQIYLKSHHLFEPKMQLLDIITVRLAAGEKKRCTTQLKRTDFEHYVSGKKVAKTGTYSICIATSAEHIVAEQTFTLECDEEGEIHENTLIGMLLSDAKYRGITLSNMKRVINFWAYGEFETEQNFEEDVFLRNSVYNMPVRAFAYFAPQEFDDETMTQFLQELKNIND